VDEREMEVGKGLFFVSFGRKGINSVVWGKDIG
jgi:hypothetical protein